MVMGQIALKSNQEIEIELSKESIEWNLKEPSKLIILSCLINLLILGLSPVRQLGLSLILCHAQSKYRIFLMDRLAKVAITCLLTLSKIKQ